MQSMEHGDAKVEAGSSPFEEPPRGHKPMVNGPMDSSRRSINDSQSSLTSRGAGDLSQKLRAGDVTFDTLPARLITSPLLTFPL